jgi:hypothetical protein
VQFVVVARTSLALVSFLLVIRVPSRRRHPRGCPPAHSPVRMLLGSTPPTRLPSITRL